MNDLNSEISLQSPTEFRPESSVRVVIKYNNRDSNGTHHIRKVSVLPTWNPKQKVAGRRDISVPAGSSKSLLATRMGVPPGLGGKQGFHVWFEVGYADEAGEMTYERQQTESPLSVPVAGAPQYNAVVCTAGEDNLVRPVRDFVQNWGFDVYLADGERAVRERISKFADTPTCFVGVITAKENDEGQQVVSNAASVALSQDVLSIILIDEDTSRLHFPEESVVVKCDLASEWALARQSGPELLGVRRLIETEDGKRFLNQIRKAAKQEPKKFLRALVYSILLERTGATEIALDWLDSPTEPFMSLAGHSDVGNGSEARPTFQGNTYFNGETPWLDMPKPYTSEEIIRVLDEMNFHLARRNGSHAVFKYRHPEDDDEVRTVVVPVDKDPLATGTLRKISEQAGAENFNRFCEWVDDVLDNL